MSMEIAHIYARLRRWLTTALLPLALFAMAQGGDSNAEAADCSPVDLKTERLPGLNTARLGHAIMCVNGEVVVLGGHASSFVPTATAEYFRNGSWHTVPLAYPHDHGTALALRSGKIFMAGGHKEPLGIGHMYSAEIYDPAAHISQGFGALDQKRAYASALEMADGQIVIAGNWYGDDGIEVFDNVYDPTNTNAKIAGQVSIPRAKPYILRISDDDAIIFGALDEHGKRTDSGIVDRLKGTSYREPFLDTWIPIGNINMHRSINQFIGDEAEGKYEWLIPVENAETGSIAIASVEGAPVEGQTPAFSLLPIAQAVPDSIQGRQITYSNLICDRNRKIAYLVGNDYDARIYLFAIRYGEKAPVPVTIYRTEPQPIMAQSTYPTITPDGNLVFAGGCMYSNFAPLDAAFMLKLIDDDNILSAAAVGSKEQSSGFAGWIWTGAAIVFAAALGVLIFARSRKKEARELTAVDFEEEEEVDESILEKYLPKDESMADLFQRIEQLMSDERLYLNPNLRASDIAVRLGTNTTYVSSAINTIRGCTFPQYLTSYRIAYAQMLMRQRPDSKISNISVQSGFSNDTTFFRAFRSCTGLSPKEWLAQIQDEDIAQP